MGEVCIFGCEHSSKRSLARNLKELDDSRYVFLKLSWQVHETFFTSTKAIGSLCCLSLAH